MLRTAIILQARMGSTRLPGKALADLAGRSLLSHCLWRLTATDLPVIVATTTRREDDAIEREAKSLGATIYRGPDQDVLGRFVHAAEAFGIVEIVRATADNPAVDIGAPERTVALRRRSRADHVVECGLPLGSAVEAMTTEALARAHALTTDAYDREHVTPFVRTQPMFSSLCAVAPGYLRRPELRLTVDTADDLQFMRTALEPFRHARRPPPLMDILGAIDALTADLRGRKGA